MQLKFKPIVLALLALGPLSGIAQVSDLGPGVTEFQRFQVYPHLDKAFEAQRRGDHQREIRELEQAHRLAPQSVAIALELAAALKRGGQQTRAQTFLRTQLERHPGDARLAKALRDLQPAAPAVAAAPPPPVASSASAPTSASTAVPAPAPAARAPSRAQVLAGAKRARPARAAASTERRRSPVATSKDAAPSGYADASRAYAAADKGKLSTALAHARAAVAHAPQNMQYKQLLVYLLLENGRIEEADSYARQIDQSAELESDPAWRDLRRSVTQHMAGRHFERSRTALAAGDVAQALQQAELGVKLAPGVQAYRLQWVGLLLRERQFARAQQVADDGLSKSDSAAMRVLLAAALQGQGQGDAASQAFDAALASSGLAPHEQLNYRLIAADAALAAGQPERATQLLAALPQEGDTGVVARQQEVERSMHRPLSPASIPTARWRVPVVNCFGTASAPGCQIWPGQNATDPASAQAQSAYQAYARHDYAAAAVAGEQAVKLNPEHLPYRLLRLQALIAGGNTQQALAEADSYLQTHPQASEVLALRSRLRHAQAEPDAASADAQAALKAGGLSLTSEVDLLQQEGRKQDAAAQFAAAAKEPGLRDSSDPNLAYLATRVGDDRTGLAVFNRAQDAGRLPVTSLKDAGYTASRMAENEQAIGYFKQAIDANADGRLELTPRQQFETRRELADRTRTWGVNALLGYRAMTPGAVGAQPAGHGDTAQLIGEGYWRPQGYRDGSFWEVYGGFAQTLYSKRHGPKGGESTQGTVGVRAKPLRNHNLVLAVERRFKIGSLSINDWLLRAGYSGGFGTDLRVEVPSWNMLNVYAEVGRFMRRKQNYLTFEAQAGRSFRMGDASSRLILTPHLVLGVDYNSRRTAAGYNGAVGAGAGLGVRRWLREDRYNAPRSYVDFSLQYRARLAGDERGRGWFVRAAMVY